MPPLPAPPARRGRLDRLDACDASAGIVTTIRDTVSTCSWIFYSECPRPQRTPAESSPPFAVGSALRQRYFLLRNLRIVT